MLARIGGGATGIVAIRHGPGSLVGGDRSPRAEPEPPHQSESQGGASHGPGDEPRRRATGGRHDELLA
jgi:hypothetical protein